MEAHKPITVTPMLVIEHAGERLAVPPLDGSVTGKALDDGLADYVLDVTVPRVHEGRDMRPYSPNDPYSCAGHTAHVEWRLEAGGQTETVRSQRFVLETVEVDAQEIRLSGHGLLSHLQAHVAARPYQGKRPVTSRDAIASVLVDDGIQLVNQGAPVRALAKSWTASTDRHQTVVDLVQGIPARLREDFYGAVLLPALDPPTMPEVTLTDGEHGTVVALPSAWDRADRPNHIVVRGQTGGDGPDFVAEAVEPEGPYAPSSYGWVSEEIENDTITRLAQAQTVAWAELAKRRVFTRIARVTAVTDWRITLDQAVRVEADGASILGRVIGLEMPVSGLGEMTIEVGYES